MWIMTCRNVKTEVDIPMGGIFYASKKARNRRKKQDGVYVEFDNEDCAIILFEKKEVTLFKEEFTEVKNDVLDIFLSEPGMYAFVPHSEDVEKMINLDSKEIAEAAMLDGANWEQAVQIALGAEEVSQWSISGWYRPDWKGTDKWGKS
jgi:hypothetical protein